jgi:hypothetical protein
VCAFLVRSNQFDASILGLEDELRRKAPHATAATTPAVAVGTPHVNGSTPSGLSSVSAGGDDARPKRSKKRRRYDDASYEGYGDDDEDGPPVNNGSGGGGGDRGGGGGGNGPGAAGSGGRDLGSGGREGWNEEKKKKKRKKVMSSLGLDIPLCNFFFVISLVDAVGGRVGALGRCLSLFSLLWGGCCE